MSKTSLFFHCEEWKLHFGSLEIFFKTTKIWRFAYRRHFCRNKTKKKFWKRFQGTSNATFWLDNEETNSFWTNLEEIEDNCGWFKSLRTYSSLYMQIDIVGINKKLYWALPHFQRAFIWILRIILNADSINSFVIFLFAPLSVGNSWRSYIFPSLFFQSWHRVNSTSYTYGVVAAVPSSAGWIWWRGRLKKYGHYFRLYF